MNPKQSSIYLSEEIASKCSDVGYVVYRPQLDSSMIHPDPNPNPVPNKSTTNTITRCNLLSQPSFKKNSPLPEYVPNVEFVQETQPDPEPFTETDPDVVRKTQAEASNPKR